MKIENYGYSASSPTFKRFMVIADSLFEMNDLFDALFALDPASKVDCVVAGQTLYFGSAEDRTFFLLSYQSS